MTFKSCLQDENLIKSTTVTRLEVFNRRPRNGCWDNQTGCKFHRTYYSTRASQYSSLLRWDSRALTLRNQAWSWPWDVGGGHVLREELTGTNAFRAGLGDPNLLPVSLPLSLFPQGLWTLWTVSTGDSLIPSGSLLWAVVVKEQLGDRCMAGSECEILSSLVRTGPWAKPGLIILHSA